MSKIEMSMPEEFKEVAEVTEEVVAPKPIKKAKLVLKKKELPKEEPKKEVCSWCECEDAEHYDDCEIKEKLDLEEAERFVEDNFRTLVAFVKKYKEMINAPKTVAKAGKVWAYRASEGAGLDTEKRYEATMIPEEKANLATSVGEFVWGVKIVNRKREDVLSYKFKVIEASKKNLPLRVRDEATNIVHKVNGGKIEIPTTDGITLIYTVCYLKEQ